MEQQLIEPTYWEVPSGLENGKFELMKMFACGGPTSTNIVGRSFDFGDLFLKVAGQKCEMPKGLNLYDLGIREVQTMRDIFSSDKNFSIFSCRTPIKLVGYLLQMQKDGRKGVLCTENHVVNYFICRSRAKNMADKWVDELRLVSLEYCNGWQVKTAKFKHEKHVFQGPCRILFANRS